MENVKIFYITKKGMAKIKKEYEQIKESILASRKEGAPKIIDAGALDGEYLTFWENMAAMEKRIFEIKHFLDRAILIQKPGDKSIVGLGATVLVETENKKKEKLTIVGSPEADPSAGLISSESPVGKSLLGHKLNEEVSVLKNVYKIKGITYQIV